jgi:hypothetical protein
MPHILGLPVQSHLEQGTHLSLVFLGHDGDLGNNRGSPNAWR